MIIPEFNIPASKYIFAIKPEVIGNPNNDNMHKANAVENKGFL